MEPKLRGVIEKMLDGQLESERLDLLSELYEKYRPLVKSKEDAMFGDVFGSMNEIFVSIMSALVKRQPTEQEKQEFLDIMDRRAEEIRSKILIAASK
ncbi:MAG: hypothetical protein ABSB71_00475 [Candidatus Bathyarchaeia archaeon]|jgi:hypothetical protein